MPPLPGMMDCDAIVASGLKGIGNKKLRSMDDALLRKLVEAVASHPKEDATIDEMVKELMKYKRAIKKQAPPSKPQEQEVQLSPSGPAENTEDGPVSSRTRSSIFKKRQVVRICAFTSLKLRLEREGLEDDWEELLSEFADMDVLLISEVRASKALLVKESFRRGPCNGGEPGETIREKVGHVCVGGFWSGHSRGAHCARQAPDRNAQ
eukprot:5253699-Prymnesium_polylepis.1